MGTVGMYRGTRRGARASLRRGDVNVLVRPQGGSWREIGAGAPGRGSGPAQLTATADLGGPAQMQFALARRAGYAAADIAPFVETELHVGGEPVWAGQMESPPEDTRRMAVEARGWQYALEDNPYPRFYVHRQTGAWRDLRDVVAAPDMGWISVGSATRTGGQPEIGWTPGHILTSFVGTGIILDMGAGRYARSLALGFANINFEPAAAAATQFYVRVTDNPAWIANSGGTPGLYEDPYVVTVSSLPGPVEVNLSSPRRYVAVFMYHTGGGGTLGAPGLITRMNYARVFSQTSYRTGAESNLTAPTVVRDALTLCPFLDQSTVLIDPEGLATSVIPELAPDSWQTPRDLIDAANAYQGWRAGVDHRKRLFFLPPAGEPELFLSSEASGGVRFQGLARASAADLYNRVLVEGVSADGTPIYAEVSAASPYLDLMGRTRTARVQVSNPASTITSLSLIGTAWIAERGRIPLRGAVTVTGEAVRDRNGEPVHPSRLLTTVGSRIRLGDLIDPETGGVGRDAVIVGASYNAQAEAATLSLDNETRRLDTLLARWGARQVAA